MVDDNGSLLSCCARFQAMHHASALPLQGELHAATAAAEVLKHLSLNITELRELEHHKCLNTTELEPTELEELPSSIPGRYLYAAVTISFLKPALQAIWFGTQLER